MLEPTDPLSILLDGIADHAIFLVDPQGRVSRWTSSAEKVFGYSESDIQGKHFACLYPPSDADMAKDELEMASAHGRFEDTGWRIRKDQSQFWADSVICPIRDEKGQLEGFSHIIRDITERRKVEEALRQKEEELSQARKLEAMGRLAGGIAHDFNNFITGIVGLADDLRLSMAEHDPRRDDLEEIIKTADQARLLTRELLAFGRKQVSSPQVLQLNQVLQSKERMLTRLLGGTIQMKMQLDPQIRHILIDPTQLDQILINLVMNSRDALPTEGGTITLETRRIEKIVDDVSLASAGPQAALIISDSGCGMDQKVLTQVFEPFFTTKKQGKGTGLGLATVHGIVTQNHGTISIRSRPGEGTSIQILFPEIDAPVQTTSSEAIVDRPVLGTETVLVVDDTDIVLRVVTQTLRNHGYTVMSATTGADALEKARHFDKPLHLLVTDVIMQEMNGRQLADQVQALHPETAVLYMSGFAEEFIQERGFLQDPEAFIQKPMTAPSLLKKVRKILDNHRLKTVKN